MVRHRLVKPSHLLLALPPLAVTIGLAILGGAELAGSHPLTMGEPRSVAEAIALRDEAGAARLAEAGEDVNAIALIRRGILFDQPVLATPVEAAVLVDAAPALDFLISRGASIDERLGCLAMDIGARAVTARLGAVSGCRKGAALEAVIDRP
jgi:hypothetical protein